MIRGGRRKSDLPPTGLAVARAVKFAWAASPFGVIGRLCVGMLQAGQGVMQAFALSKCVDAVAHGGVRQAFGWFALLGFTAVVAGAVAPFFSHVQMIVMNKTIEAATQGVMRAVTSHAGIEHLENPEFADRLEAVRSQGRSIGLLVEWLAQASSLTVAVIVSVVLLARMNAILVLPIVGVAFVGAAHVKARRRSLTIYSESFVDQRLAKSVEEEVMSQDSAADIRVLGVESWLVGRYEKLTRNAARLMVRAVWPPVLVSGVGGIVEAVILGGGVALLLHLAVTGRLSAGQVALGVVLLRNALDSAGSMGMAGADLSRNAFVARRYLALLDYESPVKPAARPSPTPGRLDVGIEFRDVSFAYPGTSRRTLDEVNLFVPAGSTIAVVGDNGAGKSTLVKLLCRLYDPTVGEILIDGVPLPELDVEMWRSRLTACFQDYGKFKFRALETIGIGDIGRNFKESAVREASMAGGASEVIASLPSGLGTQLGPEFPGGVGLSEGQWQKTACARGSMRLGPLVTILDEPTAALDPRVEHELFERFSERARAGRTNGEVVVLVSHRFSTVRMADTIVVMEEGRVLEKGTHESLMAMHGRYFELYSMQAARYR